jgi:hypothetical protein
MQFIIDNLPEAISAAKAELKAALPQYKKVFQQVEAEMRRRVDEIVAERDSGQEVIPIVQYADIAGNSVPDNLIQRIKSRGACVIRGTFPKAQAQAWNDQVGHYLEENHLDAKLANAAEDKYFGTLAAAKPQIYGVYWSKPQVEVRQSEQHTNVRVFLNHLWQAESNGSRHFDPDEAPVYADRLRRRPPASVFGLSPHVDGGSVERWLGKNFRQVYRHVFSGDWKSYNAYDAAFRPDIEEVPSPAVCSMFRTFQGWTALTRQGKGNGTLQLIPIAESMVYVLLRALQDDVPEDELCGAKPGRALSVNPEYHSLLLEAVSSIPLMDPGDTVFWHSDVVHAVETDHTGPDYSNVLYIASAPGCAKNTVYIEKQAPAFLMGKTPPDFAPDDFEVDFVGRAKVDDLTLLGRRELGITAELLNTYIGG